MSNNDLDDSLNIDDFNDGGFDDYSKKGTLGDAWRNNPMVKIGTLLAVFAIIVGGIILFGGKKDELPPSMVSSAKEVSEAPGSSEISSTMEQAIQDKNAQNVEDAARTGGSALPIPTQPSKGALPVPTEEASQEDPLERWRQMQEERMRQQQVATQTVPLQTTPSNQAPQADPNAPAVNALSASMLGQMQTILKAQDVTKFTKKDITDVKFLEDLEKKKTDALVAQQTSLAASTNGGNSIENIIIPAGTIEYAQLTLEANTDAPGPVVAEIMSGPFNGAKVLGNFTSTDRYIVLNFTTIVIDGIDYPIQAVGIDPNTTLPGVVTDIDHRYFKRVILPMAAEFVTGLTDAISESGKTTITIASAGGGTQTTSTGSSSDKQEVASGITAAGDKLSEILKDEASATKPMLRIASGTPLGILFVKSVTDSGLSQ